MDTTPLAASRTLTRRTLALVLAGGRGSRLKDLTDRRAKPAVHFGGKFRIIDFALSNCMNSGMRRIGVITQYKSHSLLRHLQRGWSFLRNEMGEFVDLLPAQQRLTEEHWYRGTADAIYQNLDIIRNSTPPDYIVVLAGDHIYKMDYSIMLADHAASGRGVTVGCIEVSREEAKGFGVMAIDEHRAIIEFVEKPSDPPPM
ncbi:MAG: glucose-phosphate adenylyltransferase, partial [Pseudomonadota bacterium]